MIFPGFNATKSAFLNPITQLAPLSPFGALAAANPFAALTALSPSLNIFNPAVNPNAALLQFNPAAAPTLALSGTAGLATLPFGTKFPSAAVYGSPFAKPFYGGYTTPFAKPFYGGYPSPFYGI